MIKSGAGGAGPQLNHQGDLVLVQFSRVLKNGHRNEIIWAKPLGADLYQLKGTLHLIAGLNFDDVIKARPLHGDSVPSFLEVVSRSGYHTLHVGFASTLPEPERSKILNQLTLMNVRAEKLLDRFWTLQIDPDGDYEGTCEYLSSLSSQELLMYEPEVEMDAVLRFYFGS